MALKLFHYDLWPSSQAARVALLEAGGPFEITTVDISAGQHNTPSFVAMNPTREPGVLVDDDGPDAGRELVMWGPLSIPSYLDANRARLNLPGAVMIPTSPCNYPLSLQWANWAAMNVLGPMQTVMLHGKILHPTRRRGPAFRAAKRTLRRSIELLNTQAPDPGQFINREKDNPQGDSGIFSIADAFIASGLTYARLFPAGQAVLDNMTRTNAYLASIEARPSFQTAFGGITIGNGQLPPLVEPT